MIAILFRECSGNIQKFMHCTFFIIFSEMKKIQFTCIIIGRGFHCDIIRRIKRMSHHMNGAANFGVNSFHQNMRFRTFEKRTI